MGAYEERVAENIEDVSKSCLYLFYSLHLPNILSIIGKVSFTQYKQTTFNRNNGQKIKDYEPNICTAIQQKTFNISKTNNLNIYIQLF